MSTVTCTHCGNVVPPSLVVEGADHQFCCNGCKTVYHLIHDIGMADYYDIRKDAGITRPDEVIIADPDRQVGLFADAEFIARHVVMHNDGSASIRWYVEGMHCAACVWLLERLPTIDDAVLESRVAFADHALDIRYDPSKTDPGQLAQLVSRLGYRAHPWVARETWERARRERRTWMLRFAVAAASATGTMHLAINILAGEATGDLRQAEAMFFGWISFIACVPAVVYSATPYYRGTLAALRLKRIGIDFSTTLVIWVGFLVSTWHLIVGRTDIYFDAVAMFICFLLGGRLVYLFARDRVAADSGALGALIPRQVRRIVAGQESVVMPEALAIGDRIRVLSGETIPIDGVLVTDEAWIDASVLTGEHRPVKVLPGATVHAGARAREDLELEALAWGAESRVGALLERLQSQGPGHTAITNMVDRLQGWFAPLVTLGAVAMFVGWSAVDPSRAWDQTVAMVLVACPCALGMATPLIFALTTSRAARQGILIRDAAVLERMADIDHVVIDKTGTLTQARLSVTQWEPMGDPHPELLGAVKAVEECCRHPIAAALVTHLDKQGINAAADVDLVDEIPGKGAKARFAGQELRIGTEEWAGDDDSGAARVVVSLGGTVMARVTVADPPRPDAKITLSALGRLRPNTRVRLASGDDRRTVAAMAEDLSIAEHQGGMTPEDKEALVNDLQTKGSVLMLGDGINDAPALKAATVSIGMRGGLEAAMDCAHVFLTRADLGLVRDFISGCRSARFYLRLALWISVAYNVLGIVAVAIGWWGPAVCAVAMPVSSLTVVAIATGGQYFRSTTSSMDDHSTLA